MKKQIEGQYVLKIIKFIRGSYHFHLNKLAHKSALLRVRDGRLKLNNAGSWSYFTAADEYGILRGGDYPWQYFQNLIPPALQNARAQEGFVSQQIALLPSNVAFSFACAPNLTHADVIKSAFIKAGFTHSQKKTYIYKPSVPIEALLTAIKPDMRNKIRGAIRDLELVTMDVEDFFSFYEGNLQAAGIKPYFNFGIDRALTKEALQQAPQQAYILAARQKTAGDKTTPPLFEAAILCTGCADGFLKLSRITYRPENSSHAVAPHKHAIKFLVYEAMKLATDLGATLDTDGHTPGGDILYKRFGVFEAIMRDEFKRKTIHIPIARAWHALKRQAIMPLRRMTYSSFFIAF